MSKSGDRITFTMHEKLLLDVIDRQAGTVEKAILEACMNSAEAGATVFEIEFSIDATGQKRLVMTDDGCGIKTRQELEEHFRQFGTPHEEHEQKKWAQFRMGRGQCFAQGRNDWKTCNWRMTTDIRRDIAESHSPSFYLTEGEHFAGCRIEIALYPDKYGGGIEQLKSLVSEQLAFMPMRVIFNGEQVNRNPRDLKWTKETDDAYFLFGVGADLTIYNMGARVEKISASQAGIVGVVVSKRMLKINFARNQVVSDCPVWQRINEIIKQNRVKQCRKRQRRLNRHERIATLTDVRDGIQPFADVRGIGLFFTTSGRSLTLNDIIKNRIPWTFAEEGNVIADKLIQSGQALCIDRQTLDDLNYHGEDYLFFSWLIPGIDWSLVKGLYRSFEVLRGNFSDSYVFVPNKDWTKVEKRLVRVLESLKCWGNRAIVIGIADGLEAWTDGSSYIAIERSFIRRSLFTSVSGAAKFFAVMIHELTHDVDTAGSHIHGEAFYRAFHDLVLYGDTCNNSWQAGGAFKHLETFVKKMERAIWEEKTAAAKNREQKAQSRIDAALTGAAASVSRTSCQGSTTEIADKTPKKKRRRVTTRFPAGAK